MVACDHNLDPHFCEITDLAFGDTHKEDWDAGTGATKPLFKHMPDI